MLPTKQCGMRTEYLRTLKHTQKQRKLTPTGGLGISSEEYNF